MAVGSAIIAGLSLAYGVASGEQQNNQQRKQRRRQNQAQDEAFNQTVRDARTSEENENRAQQRRPDIDVLLGNQQQRRKVGPTSIDADRLILGRTGLLGV